MFLRGGATDHQILNKTTGEEDWITFGYHLRYHVNLEMPKYLGSLEKK